MGQSNNDCESAGPAEAEGATDFGAMLGFALRESDEDTSVIELELRRQHCNLRGTVHGGVIMSLADAAGYWAGAVKNGVRRQAATVSLNCHFLRGVKSSETTSLRAEGHVNKQARSMYFSTILVYACPGGELVASGQGVFSFVPAAAPQDAKDK